MTPLPSFQQPPVVEVAIAVQFEELSGLTGPMIGLLWQRFRDRLPQLEVHAPRPTRFERFVVPDEPESDVTLELSEMPPSPLVWFVSSDDSELVQIQNNRLVFNWRHRGDAYPRYEYVRASFAEHLETLCSFLREATLGDIVPNQWELSYINHISGGDTVLNHYELGNVIPSWTHGQSDDFLPNPEDVTLRVRYRIVENDKPIGRLHISAIPKFTLPEKDPIIALQLIARGEPVNVTDPGDVLPFFDLGHEWIVRGFASITSSKMHEQWGREK